MKDNYGQIYKIENMINHKVYIGQTIQEDVLKDRYHYNVEKHTHNIHLKNSIHKYGWDNFSISILQLCKTKEELDDQEKYWIKYYNATDGNNGYNIDTGGHGGVLSEEGRKIMLEKIHHYWETHPEEKEKRSEMYSGSKNPLVKAGGHTDETKEKMRQIRKQQIKDGIIDIKKATKASHNPVSQRKRIVSKSKFWYIQYDLNMKELNRWHTLKDMHTYLVESKIETHYLIYKSYKQSYIQNKVFSDQLYKNQGFYFHKIPKENELNIAS